MQNNQFPNPKKLWLPRPLDFVQDKNSKFWHNWVKNQNVKTLQKISRDVWPRVSHAENQHPMSKTAFGDM